MNIAIMIHGGAHPIPKEEEQAFRDGCLGAVEAGWNVLQGRGSAMDAVEAAIRSLEADPTFNAGYGSELNAAGDVEMDAGLMEGANYQAGAVGALQGVRHPITAARRVLESEYVLLVSDGARRFAADHGAELCDPREMIHPKQQRQWEEQQSGTGRRDTVGCVALDAEGNIVAGASTGGTGSNPPGRMGDTALVGMGFYADNGLGGASLTGIGEDIARVVLAKTAVDMLKGDCHPDDAAEAAIRLLEERVQGEAGLLLLDRRGRIGWAHNAENMACAYRTSQMESAAVHLKKEASTREDEQDWIRFPQWQKKTA